MTVPLPPPTLHPRHGIHEPTSHTPARTSGSLRRTATIDMLRPEGLDGPLVLAGRGRDATTGVDGALKTVAEATCRGVVDFVHGRVLTRLAVDPGPAPEGLLGARVSSGFRGLLDTLDPALRDERNLLYLLLDDFPVATLVSGHATLAGRDDGVPPEPATGRPAFLADQCSGFVSGGTIMAGLAERGLPPTVTGPVAPSLTGPDDPDAWHRTATLPPHGMRRARRIDVHPGYRAAPATVDAMFRDSYVLSDGTETVIHEYTLSAELDPRTGVVTTCAATPRVLPWTECPVAAASAGRLTGQPLDGLRRRVRTEFGGISTCTHLNDMLRALEDVPTLLRLAADSG